MSRPAIWDTVQRLGLCRQPSRLPTYPPANGLLPIGLVASAIGARSLPDLPVDMWTGYRRSARRSR